MKNLAKWMGIPPFIQKIVRVMKISVFLVLVCTLQLSASVMLGQQVSLQSGEMSVRQVFKELKTQTGTFFMYSEDEIDRKLIVDIDFSDVSLEVALEEICEQAYLEYEIIDDYVLITRKVPAVEKPATQQENKEIKGTVTDEDGNTLPGVSVVIKGTSTGVATNIDGEYTLNVPVRGTTIIFSFVGMETQEINVLDKTLLNVVLRADHGQLGEVVITGYQNLDGRRKTASIATVDMDNIKSRVEPSIDKLLQGQVAGMTIMSTSGAPGSVPQVRIRGTSTISGNVQPLWVVDGVILDDPINVDVSEILTNKNLIASGIGGVNVSDIKSINVLKDASATAIYGTRAANGVIVITSKSGVAGKTRINYSGSTTLSMRPKIEDAYMMNSKERIDVNREMIERGVFKTNSSRKGKYGTSSDFEKYFIDVHDRTSTWDEFEEKVKGLETENTDWFKYLFRNSLTQNHSLSVSGGDEKTTFYISGSYRDEQATAKDVGQKTYTGSAKIRTKLRKNIQLDAKLDVNARENESFFGADSRENPYEWAIYTTRAHRAFDENGDYNYMYLDNMKYNFLENREAGWRDSKSFGIRGQLQMEWELMKDLRWTSLFTFSKQSTEEEDIATEDSYFVKSRKERMTVTEGYTARQIWFDGGVLYGKSTQNHSKTIRNQLGYNPVFAEDHEVNILVGHEVRTSDYNTTSNRIYGYSHDRGRQLAPQWDLIEEMGEAYWSKNLNKTANVSYYGVLGYTYKKRYTLNFNARADGSNKFGVNSNDLFQPLWSAGFNYQMKEESFLRDVNWLSYLTFRGSYGVQGNVSSQAYSDLITRIGTYNTIKKESPLNVVAPKNPNLKWERNYSTNLAMELGLFDRRVRTTFEYYYKKGEDLLGSKQVSDVIGFRNIFVNWASMENKGFEWSISTRNIDTKNFTWNTSFSGGWNKNKVLDVYSKSTYRSLTNAFKSSYASSAVIGKPLDGLWSYRYAGLNEDGRATFYTGEFEVDTEGNKMEKTALVGVNDTEALKYEGPTTPPVQCGLTNSFTYKKLSLSCLLVGSFGNVVRLRKLASQGYGIGFPEPTENMSKDMVYRWRKPGDELITNVPKIEDEIYNYDLWGYPNNLEMYNDSDLRTVKGDFVRLQNVSLSYSIYSDKLRSKGIQNILLTLQGNNLHVWKDSKLKGQDPESTGGRRNYSDARNGNVSFGNTYLPIPRSYSFSVQVNF